MCPQLWLLAGKQQKPECMLSLNMVFETVKSFPQYLNINTASQQILRWHSPFLEEV